ncbi:DNA polymerase III subunit gamma/tau [Permianibacter aggregans]|uniref:DNA polymerase III subunit gamma/tau n=1 Tax=Permianibacter aggregans TaxID=1510150 RepID=A0A4R6V5B7_9GAMM|nr:DNA polymerase III subunit gamma/tau [Permianibacter aggregans]QGX41571.1 DNA polymerase III subunit gamma/tau [Permianibacter aggregans]TDQ51374.1 DNA polymerase-3 subunit gamma/tau [Permianibacter aggregans]
MSYQVLARKWRPREFTDMVGQSHVLKALTSALSQQRLHHAYLFTGTRGVGKTTVARIFAKALNCEEGVSATPCGQCSACFEVDSGRFVDLIEVDAASRTKVEDTRDLLDNVQYLPTRGRYKVYLIDEVHMLSNSSFNALLKTLEEPPAHVMFLLATTDPQKMPVTVLSRCLQFHLKALTPEQIVARLQHILVAEKIAYDDATLPMVAKAANGSLRDALSLLDQAIAHGQGVLKSDDVRDMLGFVEHTSLAGFVAALCQKDVAATMQAIEAMEAFAPDYLAVLDELLSTLHGAAIVQQLPGSHYADNELCKRLADAIDAETLQLYYQIALHGKRDLPLAPSPREGLEMCALRMLVFAPNENSGTAQRPETPAKKPEAATAPVRQPAPVAAPIAVAAKKAEPVSEPASPTTHVELATANPVATTSEAKPEPIVDKGLCALASQWLAWLDAMKVPGLLDNLARHCALVEQQDDVLALAADHQRIEMLNGTRKSELEQALTQQLGRPIRIEIREPIPEGALTPTQLQKEREAAKRAAAEQSLNNDPRLRELLDLTEGRLLTETIRALN